MRLHMFILGVSLVVVAAPAMAATKPNIIFFLVDDYDKPETSVYGGKVLTPNLERLAREGMTFHNAYMTSTVCTPSRYTCLTGRYAGSSYAPVYLAECPLGQQGLPAFNVALEHDNMNVGQVLAQNGYATGFVGKYHVGIDFEQDECARHGLHYIPKNADYSDALNRQMRENETRCRELVKERGFTWAKHIYPANMKAPWKGHNPEWTIAAALEFVETHKDGPFYLHYGTTLLHGPNGEWFRSLDKPLVTGEGMIERPLDVMPPRRTVMERITKAGLTTNEAGYLWMDDSLGVLLDKLDELGIADNTVVLFIADHGSELKGSLYRHRGMEVPCVMRWPAGMKQGVACHELIQNTDFVPTWFELAGVKRPKGYRMDGVSMASLFRQPNRPVRDYVYGEMGPSRSIKTRDWSYLALRYTRDQIESVRADSNRIVKRLQGLSGGVSRAKTKAHAFECDQLYRLSRDPREQKNLARNPEFQAKLQEMKAMLSKELKRFPNRPYGEFVAGGNAVPMGAYDDVLRKMAQASVSQEKPARQNRARDRKNRQRRVGTE